MEIPVIHVETSHRSVVTCRDGYDATILKDPVELSNACRASYRMRSATLARVKERLNKSRHCKCCFVLRRGSATVSDLLKEPTVLHNSIAAYCALDNVRSFSLRQNSHQDHPGSDNSCGSKSRLTKSKSCDLGKNTDSFVSSQKQSTDCFTNDNDSDYSARRKSHGTDESAKFQSEMNKHHKVQNDSSCIKSVSVKHSDSFLGCKGDWGHSQTIEHDFNTKNSVNVIERINVSSKDNTGKHHTTCNTFNCMDDQTYRDTSMAEKPVECTLQNGPISSTLHNSPVRLNSNEPLYKCANITAGDNECGAECCGSMSSLGCTIDHLRREMASLMDTDLSLMKQLLTLNEAIEDLKWGQRRGAWADNSHSSHEGSYDMIHSAASLSDRWDIKPVVKFSTPSSLSLQLEDDSVRFSVYNDDDNTNTFNRAQHQNQRPGSIFQDTAIFNSSHNLHVITESDNKDTSSSCGHVRKNSEQDIVVLQTGGAKTDSVDCSSTGNSNPVDYSDNNGIQCDDHENNKAIQNDEKVLGINVKPASKMCLLKVKSQKPSSSVKNCEEAIKTIMVSQTDKQNNGKGRVKSRAKSSLPKVVPIDKHKAQANESPSENKTKKGKGKYMYQTKIASELNHSSKERDIGSPSDSSPKPRSTHKSLLSKPSVIPQYRSKEEPARESSPSQIPQSTSKKNSVKTSPKRFGGQITPSPKTVSSGLVLKMNNKARVKPKPDKSIPLFGTSPKHRWKEDKQSTESCGTDGNTESHDSGINDVFN